MSNSRSVQKTTGAVRKKRDRHAELLAVVRTVPTDYTDYGGEIERWADGNKPYPDCSCGCRWAVKLTGSLGADWVVCSKPNGPRAGLLTFEHQTGSECFE